MSQQVGSREGGIAGIGAVGRSLSAIASAWVVLTLLAGCTAVQRVPDKSERTYLELKVEPKTTEVYVDGEYRGEVGKWGGGMLPVTPGPHRVKLQADGYITRRWDMDFEAGELKTLTLEMEPVIDNFSESPDAG